MLVLPNFYFSRQTRGRKVESFLTIVRSKTSTFRLFEVTFLLEKWKLVCLISTFRVSRRKQDSLDLSYKSAKTGTLEHELYIPYFPQSILMEKKILFLMSKNLQK